MHELLARPLIQRRNPSACSQFECGTCSCVAIVADPINSCMSACVVTYTWIAFALTQAHPKMMQHPTSFIVRNSTTNKGSTKHPSQPRWVYNWLIIKLFTCRTGVGCTKRSKINVFFLELCTDLPRTMKTVNVRQPRRSEVGFSHNLMLNWISVNKLRLWLM